MVQERERHKKAMEESGVVTPKEAWDVVWNLDQELRPWDKLTPDERRRWRAYVNSGLYAEARKKAENNDD